MATMYTFTVELGDSTAAADIRSLVEESDDLVGPKQPDEHHVVIHSGVHASNNPSVVRELLTASDGVSRVGFTASNDTTDTAAGSVYWLEDGEVRQSETFEDSSQAETIDEQKGTGAARRAREAVDFEMYSWWDYSVENMEKRWPEDVHEKMAAEGLIEADDGPN